MATPAAGPSPPRPPVQVQDAGAGAAGGCSEVELTHEEVWALVDCLDAWLALDPGFELSPLPGLPPAKGGPAAAARRLWVPWAGGA